MFRGLIPDGAAGTAPGAGRLLVMLVAAIGALAAGLLFIASPFVYLAAIGGIVVGAIILARPSIGFDITLLTIPLEAVGTLGKLLPFINVTPAKMFALVTMAAFVVHVVQRRIRPVWSREMTALTVFFGLAAASVALSDDRTAGYQALVRLGSTVAFYVLAANMMRTPADVRRAVVLLSLSSTLTFGFAIAQRYVPSLSFDMRAGWEEQDQRYGVERQTIDAGQDSYIERSSGTSVHSIILAVNSAIIVAALAALARASAPDAAKALFTACAFVSVVAAATSFARTGFIAYLSVAAALLALRVIRVTPLRVALLLAGAVVGLIVMPSNFRERILSPSSYSVANSESLQIRMDLWDAGFRIVKDHPLLGMGLGNTKDLQRYWDFPLNDEYMTVHNAYLQVAMEVGIPGLCCLLVFFGLTIASFLASIRALRSSDGSQAMVAAGLLAGILALLVAGTGLDFMNQTFKNAWLFIAAAPVYARATRRSASERSR